MSLRGVDLNLLTDLEALLTEGNVTRAAERVSVGQPAMSAALGRLRRHFQDPLLVREGRQMVLTPLAESLIDPVRAATAAADSVMLRETQFDPARVTRSFTVITTDYMTMVLLRPLLTELRHEAPNLRVVVRQAEADFADQLRKGHADLVMLPTQLAEGHGFPGQFLYTDRYVLVVAADNPHVGEAVTLEEFLALRYVAYETNSITPIINTELAHQGLRLQVEVTTPQFAIAPFLVAGTHLGTLTLQRLTTELAAPAGLRVLEVPVPLHPIHEAMYWHPRHTDEPVHRWLREKLASLAAQL